MGEASSLHVQTGSVTYQITASQAGEMLFDDATTLTILDCAYPLRSITQIYFSDIVFPDDAVNVTYADTAATVTVAGNVARYLTVTVEGSHVTIVPSDDLESEIT